MSDQEGIGKMTEGHPLRKIWIPFLFFMAVSVWLMIRQTTPHGIGISPDSTAFIRQARDIVAHGLDFLGTGMSVTHPPGYALVLAGAALLTGKDPLAAAVLVNVIALALIILLFMLDARRITGVSPWLSGLVITFALPLNLVSAMAWSECLFVLVVYGTLRLAVSRDQGLLTAILLGIMVCYAFLIRYLGLAIVPVVLVQLYLFSSPDAVKRRINSLVFLGTALLFMGSFLLRNHLVSGTLFGIRAPSRYTMGENLQSIEQTFYAWFVPEIPISFITRSVLVIAAAAFIWFTRDSLAARFSQWKKYGLVHPIFLLVFTALLALSATTTAFDQINSRLLAPVFPALAITILFVIAPGHGTGRSLRLSRIARWLLVVILIAQPVRIIMKDTHRRGREGAGGYNRPEWRESPLIINCLPNLPVSDEFLFSNAPNALYLLAGVEANNLPGLYFYNSESPTGVTEDNLFEKFPSLDGALVIWFDWVERDPAHFTIDELGAFCRVQKIEDCGDGAIYRVDKTVARTD